MNRTKHFALAALALLASFVPALAQADPDRLASDDNPRLMWYTDSDLVDVGFNPTVRAYLSREDTPQKVADTILKSLRDQIPEVAHGQGLALMIQNNAAPWANFRTWIPIEKYLVPGDPGSIRRALRITGEIHGDFYREVFLILKHDHDVHFEYVVVDVEGAPSGLNNYHALAEVYGWQTEPNVPEWNWGGIGWGQHVQQTLRSWQANVLPGLRSEWVRRGIQDPAREVWGAESANYNDYTACALDFRSPVLYHGLRKINERDPETNDHIPFRRWIDDTMDSREPQYEPENYENPLDQMWRHLVTLIETRRLGPTIAWVHDIPKDRGNYEPGVPTEKLDPAGLRYRARLVHADAMIRISYQLDCGIWMFNPGGELDDRLVSLIRQYEDFALIREPPLNISLEDRDRDVWISWFGDPAFIAEQMNTTVPGWLRDDFVDRPGEAVPEGEKPQE